MTAVANERLTIADACLFMDEAALAALKSNAADRYRRLWRAFVSFAAAFDNVRYVDEVGPEVINAFVESRLRTGGRPQAKTRHTRLDAMRFFFKRLRVFKLTTADPCRDLVVELDVTDGPRPLDDDEVEECRRCSLATIVATRYPLIWALAESGASMGEIGWVAWSDIDIAEGTVRLSGGKKEFPRRVVLTEWGSRAFRDHVENVGITTQWVAVDRAVGFDSRRSSVTAVVTELLGRAGLRGDDGVEPRSVAAWAGRRVLRETGRIDRAAYVLGFSSLDSTARLLRYDWKSAT